MKYVLVTWPESQLFMELDWFDECILMNDENYLEEFGSSAYLVPEHLYERFIESMQVSQLWIANFKSKRNFVNFFSFSIQVY